MLIKITDFPDDLIEALKVYVRQATASKAVSHAASTYINLSDQLVMADGVISDLQLEVARLNRIIEQARSAAAALLDKTAQGDLL